MDVREQGDSGAAAPAFAARDDTGDSLASLAGGPLAARFCAWRGLSGRRYVATVYPVDRGADRSGLPDFEAFVLIAVASGPTGRHILDVTPVERASESHRAIASGLAAGACEWHVHLLADDRRARAAMIGDLRARHCGAAVAACA